MVSSETFAILYLSLNLVLNIRRDIKINWQLDRKVIF